MERIDRGGMFGIAVPYSDDRLVPAYPGVAQNIGAALAFIVVIIGWAIGKLFGRDLLA